MAEENKDDKNKDTPDPAKQIADLANKNAELIARLEKLEGKGKDENKNDDDLSDKARKQRETEGKSKADQKALEGALKFAMGAESFLKTNETLLPKDVADIFKAADKENYGTATEKDRAIKSGIVQSFFAVQANLDLLTPSQKSALDDYLKLTKNVKQEKALEMYDNIFEPTFEMLKRLKKAEALGKGLGGGTDAETAYKNKLMQGSRKHYLGEKSQ